MSSSDINERARGETFHTNPAKCGVTGPVIQPKIEGMKWTARQITDDTFYLENGEHSTQVTGAHCKCCALLTAVQEYGGKADRRGLHRYGVCYQFMVAAQNAQEDLEGSDS